jgi:predicted dehydrogenase
MNSTLHSLPPRIALIGISGYGNIHLQLAQRFRDRGEIVIVAATVINPEEVPADLADLREFGCEIFGDYETMLKAYAGRIDLCLIPTGIHWHARMTIAALEAGANVLVEKPLSGVRCEVEAVQAAERASGCFVAVGFQDYYEPSTAWLKQHLLNGDIGKIESVKFLGMWPRPREYFCRNGWAGRLRVEGKAVFDSPLSNAFAHFAMLSLYFAGRTLAGVAESELLDGQLWRAHAIETFDSAIVRLRTPDKIELWFGVTHACHDTVEPEILITGERGTAGWRYEKETWWCGTDGVLHRRELPDAHGARLAMMETTLRRLTDSTAMICTSVLAGRHTQVVESLHAAIPVMNFPPSEVIWSGEGDAAVPTQIGFESALFVASRSRSLLVSSNAAVTRADASIEIRQ